MSTSPVTEPVSEIARFARFGQTQLTADDYLRLERKRLLSRVAWGVVFALVTAGTLVLAPEGIAFILPFLLLLCVVLPIVLWHYPRAILYITLLGVCLIEILPTGQPDAITDRIPLFLNVNTVVQVYAHVNVKAIPLSVFECLLLVAGICSLIRAVFTGNVKIRLGPLFWPIFGYICFVIIAVVNGMATGGDFKIALQETRAQFCFLIAYLMAVNLVRTRQHCNSVLWMIAFSIAFKGVLYAFRRYVTLHGMAITDQGVGSHEEAYFFDCFILLVISLLCFGVHPRLRTFMLWLLPLVELGNIATNRRAGTAALAVVFPIILLGLYQGFPKRRRATAIIGLSAVILLTAYYFTFRNSESAIAQPARAIKSQFDPDVRDAGSNGYRDAENADQMATIRSAPLGYGYGKRFLHVAVIADISQLYDWWDVLPHNSILWIWMRTGIFGFIAFWIMISASVICCAQVSKDTRLDAEYRMLGFYGMLVVACQLIFGLLDIQMANPRDIMFTASFVGIVASIRTLPNSAGSSDGDFTSARQRRTR